MTRRTLNWTDHTGLRHNSAGIPTASPPGAGRNGKNAMKPCLMLLPALGLGLATMQADAQAWPAKPGRAIVAAGAGSTIDIVPRIVFEQLSTQLGQPIIVENRGGAGGTLAAHFVANAEPDGYNILDRK